jgi:hypothetical protein
MRKILGKSLVVIAACAIASIGARATTFTGTVHNGTSNTPAAGVDVVLISLQNEMTTVANTKTDASGHYSMDYAQSGQMPMLVRAIYKGVNFHGMLPPGKTTADVEVFEPDSNPKTVDLPARMVAFQPQPNALLIGEEYEVQNQSNPPKAYFNAQGDFDFHIPDGAQISDVSAQGPEGMPVTQGTIDKGKDHYAIAFAFRPGMSLVRISYQLPYQGNATTVHLPTDVGGQRVMFLAAPSVNISSSGFQPAGSDSGMNVYTRESVPAGTTLDVAVSGVAPAADAQQQQQPPDPAGAQSANGHQDGEPVVAVPPRIDNLKWALLAGFGAMFLLGMAYLWRRPMAVVNVPGIGNAAIPASPAGMAVATSIAPREETASPLAGPAATAAASMAGIDREVGTSLDQLKDTLFRLELRHQAGTIGEQEYQEQRARAEKILRDLVRG